MRGGCWLSDYMFNTFTLVPTLDESFKDCMLQAYGNSLEKNHPWIVRTAVKAGMLTIGSKEKFFSKLVDDHRKQGRAAYSEDLLKKEMVTIGNIYKQLRDHYLAFFKANGMLDV